MKKSVIGIILLITVLWMIAPVWAEWNVTQEWNATYHGGSTTANGDYAHSIMIDSSSNVYITGDIYPGSGPMQDYYTIKYNSSGDEQWAKQYNGGNTDKAMDLYVDSSGNVYVTGYGYNLDGNTDYDWHTIKYNSSGDEQWSETFGSGLGNDRAYTIGADNSGNVYVGGYADNGPKLIWTIRKYDSSGNYIKNTTFDSAGTVSIAYDIAVDSSDNVYVTGYGNNGSRNYWQTIKYNSTLDLQWNASYDGGESSDIPYGIDIDSSGNVYVTGYSYLGGNNDYYTIKYDSSGNHVWNATYDDGSAGYGTGIAADSSGNVYVAGKYYNGADYDWYMIKYDSDGNELGNISFENSGNDNAADVDVDSSGNVYAGGTGTNLVAANSLPDYLAIKYSQQSATAGNIQSGLDDLNLSYSQEEKDSLESLYNNATGSVTIGNETWYYSGDVMAGRSIGEGWEENGYYYIKLGSGITTEAQGGSGGGNGTGYVNVSITTTLAIEVIQEDVDFGEGAVNAGESNAEIYTNQANAPTQNRGNWTLPNAYAIEVRNVGNINCSLDIASSKTASSFLGGTNPEYQWKVSDKESGSCSGGLTHGSWYDVNSSARLCQHLSPINSSDEIFLDIRVVVPYDANPTDSLVHKTDILTLTASATA
jgi:hypothetical protein